MKLSGITSLFTAIALIQIGSTTARADGTIISVHSPRNLQVFQRATRTDGAVLVSGRVRAACDKVEARITGTSIDGTLPGKWRRITLDPATGGFRSTLPTKAGGWYKVEIRAKAKGKTVGEAAVDKVGVGEVFVGAGQSNSTNSGQMKIQQHSGMVSTFSGTDWRIADDPQPGTHDRSGGGSFWPAFGDAMYERYKVPIGVAVTGHGGTSVNQWQPDHAMGLFPWMMTRIHQLGPGGFRGVLWHQGESDVQMPVEEYVAKMTTVIEKSKSEAGWEFPWFVAMVSYHNPEHPSWPNTRAAHKKLWETGVALQGPDTDTLVGDTRDFDGKGIHFSPKGLTAHGKMWAEDVALYLDRLVAH